MPDAITGFARLPRSLAGLAALCLAAAPLAAAPLAAAPLAAQDTDDDRVSSASGARLTIGGFLQADGRVVVGDDRASGPLLRRARLIFDATGERGFRLRLQPDFGQGRVLIQDAFIGWRGDGRDLRVGRFRPTFGGERTRGSATLLFPERGLVNTLMPARSTGAQATFGSARGGVVVGAFRTPLGDDARTVDTDGDLAIAPPPTTEGLLRLQGTIGRTATPSGLAWHVAVLGGSAQGRRTDGTGPARLLTVGQRPIFAYATDGPDPAVASGRRWRAAAGVEHVSRRDAWHVEAIGAEDGVRNAAFGQASLLHGGFGAAWSRVWRGTRAGDYTIVPADARGAIEAGLRGGGVWVDRDALGRFAAPGSSGRAIGLGAALSWLPAVTTRLALSYDVTIEDRGANRIEHAIILRVQQGF
ncbi:MAG: porin [Gemmatimonadota bacterium]|jgi:phosphate-selective porin OprO/OprP